MQIPLFFDRKAPTDTFHQGKSCRNNSEKTENLGCHGMELRDTSQRYSEDRCKENLENFNFPCEAIAWGGIGIREGTTSDECAPNYRQPDALCATNAEK